MKWRGAIILEMESMLVEVHTEKTHEGTRLPVS